MDKRNRCMATLIGKEGFKKGNSLVLRALCVCVCVCSMCACVFLCVPRNVCGGQRTFQIQSLPYIFKKSYFAVLLCGC